MHVVAILEMAAHTRYPDIYYFTLIFNVDFFLIQCDYNLISLASSFNGYLMSSLWSLFQTPAAGFPHSFQSTPLSSLAAQAGESSDMVKEIEVLKEQLRIYADDFKCERQDRERMQDEKEKLENELKEAKERIALLENQVVGHGTGCYCVFDCLSHIIILLFSYLFSCNCSKKTSRKKHKKKTAFVDNCSER